MCVYIYLYIYIHIYASYVSYDHLLYRMMYVHWYGHTTCKHYILHPPTACMPPAAGSASGVSGFIWCLSRLYLACLGCMYVVLTACSQLYF